MSSNKNQNSQGKANAFQINDSLTANTNGESMSKVLAQLETMMGKGAPVATLSKELKVMPSAEWTYRVSVAMLDAAYMYQNHVNEDLTAEILSEYLNWTLMNRINYLHKGRNEVHPKNVIYPVVMYDALARMTRYDGVTENGSLVIPKVEGTMSEETVTRLNAWLDKNDKAKTKPRFTTSSSWIKGDKVIAFPYHDELERLIQLAGIQTATGLPMTRTASSRVMFEMDIDTEGQITTAGEIPSISDVFARCFYSFEAISELVGMQKVELILYKAVKSELHNIVAGYVKNFKG